MWQEKLISLYRGGREIIDQRPALFVFVFILTTIIFFLNSAFCIFHKSVPIGKMRGEAAMLSLKIKDVFIRHSYCKSYGNCSAREFFYWGENCNNIEFNFYSGMDINVEVRAEIIAQISKYSTYPIQIYFYEQMYENVFPIISSPTTKAFIARK